MGFTMYLLKTFLSFWPLLGPSSEKYKRCTSLKTARVRDRKLRNVFDKYMVIETHKIIPFIINTCITMQSVKRNLIITVISIMTIMEDFASFLLMMRYFLLGIIFRAVPLEDLYVGLCGEFRLAENNLNISNFCRFECISNKRLRQLASLSNLF